MQLRIGELQRKRKGLLDSLDQMLRKDPFKLQAVASTPRQERPVLNVPDSRGTTSLSEMRGTTVFSESKPMSGGNTSKPKKAESLAECLAVLDSLQAEMNQNTAKEVKKLSPEMEDDKKYLELIDLLTNKMFDPETNVGTKQKKANSLPRSGSSIPEARLRKSSSQVFSPSKASKPALGQLSAYERLFGVPSPSSSRCTSPVVKKTGLPMIIPKVRRGSGERPTALGRGLSSSSPARSHENVNVLLPPCTSEEKKKEKISLHSIDGLLSAPEKIEIPTRYQPEVEKTSLMSLTEQESRSAKAILIKKMLVETGASCTLSNQGLL